MRFSYVSEKSVEITVLMVYACMFCQKKKCIHWNCEKMYSLNTSVNDERVIWDFDLWPLTTVEWSSENAVTGKGKCCLLFTSNQYRNFRINDVFCLLSEYFPIWRLTRIEMACKFYCIWSGVISVHKLLFPCAMQTIS